jgi:protein-S-isoprenylcysteine O-methyltransferase Ste14
MKEIKGEHPFDDAGQLILAALFLIVWVGDSFFFHWSTFLADSVPNSIRNALLGFTLLITFILFMTGRFVISGKERPGYVVDTGPFHYVRHPIYLAALIIPQEQVRGCYPPGARTGTLCFAKTPLTNI